MKSLLAYSVTLVFFGLCALSVWYVSSRLYVLFGLKYRWPIHVGVAGAVIGALIAMGATAKLSSSVVGVLNILGGYVFTFHLYLLLSLLCLHVIQLQWNLPVARTGMTVLIPAFVITLASALRANSFTINVTEIRLPGLKKEVTVMQISDLHLGHHRGRAYLARIAEETNLRKPDFVLITGDLVDANSALEPGVLDPLSDFMSPVYFVGGNHEKYIDTARALDLITGHGVRVLHNEVVETNGLQLVGLDYMNADDNTFDMHPSDDMRTIRSILPNIPLKESFPTVLMHHSPVGTQYVAEAGTDLMVSGHTHAGQIFPATLFAELIFPFNRGLHQKGKLRIFVSQGAGTYLLRNRLGSSNEIDLLRLTPSF